MNMLEIFGNHDNGQELKMHTCLHRYSVSAGYYENPVIELPISEMEETLMIRLPVEKRASASGLENIFFSECFLRTKKRYALDGMLCDAASEDVRLSLFQALKWYVANIGKDVVWEILNVEVFKKTFVLKRHEHYVTADYNSAAERVAVSYSAADAWAKAYCGRSAESLVTLLRQKLNGLPAGSALQLKN